MCTFPSNTRIWRNIALPVIFVRSLQLLQGFDVVLINTEQFYNVAPSLFKNKI